MNSNAYKKNWVAYHLTRVSYRIFSLGGGGGGGGRGKMLRVESLV